MTGDIHARLQGGPFDGDRGCMTLENEPPPPLLWVFKCGNPGCPIGTHWDAAEHNDAERYHHAEVDGEVHVYRWADPQLESPDSDQALAYAGTDTDSGGS